MSVIDLHIDSFIWMRLLGLDLGRVQSRLQTDLPRASKHLAGGVWSITTFPWKPQAWRSRSFFQNLERFQAAVRQTPGVRLVRSVQDYERARDDGDHAVWLGIQGGNALRPDEVTPELGLTRCTLMGFTHSAYGGSSQTVPQWLPRPRTLGLTPQGIEMVHALDQARVFVDLAHSDRSTFFGVVDVHDADRPLMVSHCGVQAVHRTPRNMDDDQLRAIAFSGGVVGIILKQGVIGDGPQTLDRVIDHMDHVVKVAGEDTVALGSDWDGFMTPPTDLQSPEQLPALRRAMEARGWPASRIDKALGGNFLRALAQLRS